MSVIRDALRRESGNGPSSLPNPTPLKDQDRGKTDGGSPKKRWMIVGLLCLVAGGMIGYFFFFLEANKAPVSLIPQPKVQVLDSLSSSSSPSSPTAKPIGNKTPLTTEREPRQAVSVFQPQPTFPREKRGKAKAQAARMKPLKVPESSRPEGAGEEPTARQWYNEAVRAQEQKEYDRALEAYARVLALRPHHAETYNNLGLIHLDRGRPDLAREMFEKALILQPRYLKGMNNLGLAYFQEGRWEEAGDQFRKILELDPGFLPAYINLAAVYSRQGQREQARKVLMKVLDYQADYPEACYNLGLLWERDGVEDKALIYYRKFIQQAQGPNQALADALKKRFPQLR